jgi:STE24 endopeptidase
MDASKRSTKLNAFFTGLGKTREVVLYDTLIEKLTEAEILAVLAHELGHATHKDSWKLLIRQNLLFAVYVLLFGVILGVEAFFTGFGLTGVHYGFALLLLVFLIEPCDMVLGILMNHLSRVAEYQADAYAKKHTDSTSMQSALRKLTVANYSNLTPHPLYQLLHYSHPTTSNRLSALDRNHP